MDSFAGREYAAEKLRQWNIVDPLCPRFVIHAADAGYEEIVELVINALTEHRRNQQWSSRATGPPSAP